MGCGASSAQLDGKTIGVDLQPGMEGCMMVGKGRSHDGLGMTGVVVSSPSRQQLACDVPVIEARANVCASSSFISIIALDEFRVCLLPRPIFASTAVACPCELGVTNYGG
jgi:hypothetical protein